MRSLLNISRISLNNSLKKNNLIAQVLRVEKLANIQSNSQNQQNDNLKKLKQFMEYHKFSKAIKEIDRLAQEKVDIPIQNILEQLVRNEEFELTNKLYDILQKQEIKLSDISYNYLIDANLKFKNNLNALNIAIHAYLAGVVLDIEAYRGLFSSIPPDMDNSFRQVLYKMYKQNFNLSTKILYDLVILANATKDYELLAELEEDTMKQGLKMPENLNKMINREAAANKKKQKSTENEPAENKEVKKQEEVQEVQIQQNEKQYGYQPVFSYDDIIPAEQNSNAGKYGFNQNSVFNYQNMDVAGNDILRFLKKGQQKGIFSAKQSPMIFVIKQQALSDYDEMEVSDEEYSSDIGYEGEGLNSYSDEDSD
ncbi:hypothetical protein ABPG74_013319 [Tetrahymena malaccensis]